MFTRTLILNTWLMAMLMLCSRSLIAGEANAIPQRFHARIGGFKGSCEVQLQDGRLQYALSGRGHKSHREVQPTPEQWRAFRRELDAIGVWRWRAQYVNPRVCDGTQWSLDVAYSDRAVKSQGSNDYPQATSDPLSVPAGSEMFTRYLKAVQRLLGGIAFE
jgi:hypothetical protein